MKIAIKGDRNSNIKAIKQVMTALTDKVNVQKFNLITTLAGNAQKQVTKVEDQK
jgi:hypothetical protein